MRKGMSYKPSDHVHGRLPQHLCTVLVFRIRCRCPIMDVLDRLPSRIAESYHIFELTVAHHISAIHIMCDAMELAVSLSLIVGAKLYDITCSFAKPGRVFQSDWSSRSWRHFDGVTGCFQTRCRRMVKKMPTSGEISHLCLYFHTFIMLWTLWQPSQNPGTTPGYCEWRWCSIYHDVRLPCRRCWNPPLLRRCPPTRLSMDRIVRMFCLSPSKMWRLTSSCVNFSPMVVIMWRSSLTSTEPVFFLSKIYRIWDR